MAAKERLRRTRVAIDWFWDPEGKRWRFHPTDLAHRAEYERTDAVGNPLQPARATEAKGWLPAVQAIQMIPESHKSMPEPVKDLYGSLVPEKATA